MTSLDFIISNNHPSIPGHFPGNPIVPGAVIIENVIEKFYKLGGSKEVVSLPTVKFIKPIAANQKIVVCFRNISPILIHFECIYNNQVSVLGRLKVK